MFKQFTNQTKRFWSAALLALLATFLLAAGAFAAGVPGAEKAAAVAAPAGKLHVSPEKGAGRLELRSVGEGVYKGNFVITNQGTGPLKVVRVVARTSAQDPRLPKGVSVRWAGKAVSLAPQQSQTVQVTWSSAATRAQQLFGHVLVESDALAADGTPGRAAAIGIHAEKFSGPLASLWSHILSIMVFLPLLGVVGMFVAHLMGYRDDKKLRLGVLGLMGANLALAAGLYLKFDSSFIKVHGNDGYQFMERAVWVRSLNIEYFIGIDGISVSMVLLTALISFVGVLCSWSINKQMKGYFAMYCLLVTGMMGTFVALDLLLFFVFWEVMLLPMYFLIGIWGGPRRQYAAIKFFIYTLSGSVFMLLCFIFFYLNGDPTYLVDGQAAAHSLAIPELSRMAWATKGLTILGISAVKLVWVWLFIGFAIKIPMFPFHTWLPDAHVEAPTAISVILAGVLLKMGTYGIMRINMTILPEATQWAAPAMAVFGTIGILYGAFCAMAQKDLKKLVAYSSVSHMGFTLLALGSLTPMGIEACIVQMFNHGLITSMLFILVGVVYDRVHTRDLDKFGGLASEMPLYTSFMGFALMASLGLPGLSGFWGEAMTFIGAFPRYRVLTILAATGVIVTAAYHLWALQRMFLGKFREEWRKSDYLKGSGGRFPEINKRELASVAPLAVLVLVLGFYPRPLLNLIDAGAAQLHRMVDKPGPTQIAQLDERPPLPELAQNKSPDQTKARAKQETAR
ncbi:MAG: NADH-quinone oxidoreductase subunit M [Polyangiaceae bacterium]